MSLAGFVVPGGMQKTALPDADLDLLFGALRFVAAHTPPEDSAGATGSGGNGDGTPPPPAPAAAAAPSSPSSSSLSLSPTPTPPSAANVGGPGRAADSDLAANRAARAAPPAVAEALEALRMAATNLPVDMAAVRSARGRLRSALFAAYASSPALLADVADLFNAHSAATAAAAATARRASRRRSSGNAPASTAAAAAAKKKRASLTDSTADDAERDRLQPVPRPVGASGVEAMRTMQEIVPGLYCGSYHPAADKAQLAAAGVTHVCCCIGTAPRFPGDFMYLTITAADTTLFQIAPFFDRTFDFIENALVAGGGVLVHCGAGISRAPTVVAAYLIRKLRLPSVAAIELVQRRRPYANPNMGFRKQLADYARRLGLEKRASAAGDKKRTSLQ